MAVLREWADAIIIAYVLAMFIRTFVVELFKIPSGSMTPTLVGDYVAEVDYDGDGDDDLLVLKDSSLRSMSHYQIWIDEGDRWIYAGENRVPLSEIERLHNAKEVGPLASTWRLVAGDPGAVHRRNDKIFVNKFLYWFAAPDRGDLVVFKVPEKIWAPDRPIYIKRLVAFEGETATFEYSEACGDDKGRLAIDGELVDDPPVFRQQCYDWRIRIPPGIDMPAECEYDRSNGRLYFEKCEVPEGHVFVLGDNTEHSSDGRYWGAAPIENLKGKAFFRYSPLGKIGFLE